MRNEIKVLVSSIVQNMRASVFRSELGLLGHGWGIPGDDQHCLESSQCWCCECHVPAQLRGLLMGKRAIRQIFRET